MTLLWLRVLVHPMFVNRESLLAWCLRSLLVALFVLSCRTSALAQPSAYEARSAFVPAGTPMHHGVSAARRDHIAARSLSPSTLLLSGVSVSLGVAAMVTALRARDLHEVLESHCARDGSCPYQAFVVHRDRGRALHRGSIGLSIGALATAAVAALLFVRDTRRPRRTQLDLMPHAGGLEARLAAVF